MTRRKSFLSPSVGEMYSLKRKSVSTMPSAWRWSAREASAKLSASRRNFRLNSFCALARMRPQPVDSARLRKISAWRASSIACVEIAERETAPRVFGPAGDALARRVQPRQVEVAAQHALEPVDEGLVLGEVRGAEVAHRALLWRSARAAGGREPSG